MSNREQWVGHIQQSLVGRFSYLRGNSSLAMHVLPDPSDLEGFIKSLTANVSDRKLLFCIYFLLQPSLHTFLFVELPALLKSASHRSLVTRVERRGGPRGPVDWPSTMRLRLTSRPDPSFLVCRATTKTFATPENELVKFALHLIDQLVDLALVGFPTGAMHQRFVAIREQVRLIGKHPYLRDVPSVTSATPLMKARAKRNRDSRYSALVAFVAQFQEVFVVGSWPSTLALIQAGYLLPILDDDIFELHILVHTLETLENDQGFGEPAERGPIVASRGAVAKFRHPERPAEVVCVYFDQSPSGFGSAESEYVRVASGYGLSSAPRRPDISLLHTLDGLTTGLFIEMKKSDDRQYGRDSIYKALGYLRDFSGLWKASLQVRPKIAVVFPIIAAPLDATAEGQEDLWLVSDADPLRLGDVIRSFLSRM